jgi:phosphatidylglycerophosphate synthase
MAAELPPFASVLKSRDVEDPVNLWLHRPVAYGVVALLYRTPVTPNVITLVAMLVGVSAAICWFLGTPTLLVTGGVLLWASSILDGADGILARVKQLQSDVGRALDGTADAVVAAFTVAGGFYQIWIADREVLHLTLMPIALITAVVQIYLYDYYKETYMRATTPGPKNRRETPEAVAERLDRARSEGRSFAVRFALITHIQILQAQRRLIRLTNSASEEVDGLPNTEASITLYRRHNYGPMQLWTLISLCPHTYLMALSAILQRLDLYLWYRVVGGNLIFIAALIWQHQATLRVLREREEAVTMTPASTTPPEID